MIHGVTPQMARNILAKAKNGTLSAQWAGGDKVVLEGYTLSKKAFCNFKARLAPGYRIEFV